MQINIATLFPEMFTGALENSILQRAQDKDLIKIDYYNYRDYTQDRYKSVDDTCYGGGAGMLMKIEPVHRTIDAIIQSSPNQSSYFIYPSPKGKIFEQSDAVRLSNLKSITFLCGHYEGFDQRIIDKYVDEELSIGDFVLTGGELPAMCMIDAIARLVRGVLSEGSAENESFSNFLLEYPQYTKPREYEGMHVPEVLFGGNHKKIANWKHKQSLEITMQRRPDLYLKYLKSRGLL